MKTLVASLAFLLLVATTSASSALAAADRQSFLGAGVGFEVLSKNGSGTGFYFQGLGGYAFSPNFAVGLHAGYSRVSSVQIATFDFGGFLQVSEETSSLYGRLYLDGIRASTDPGGKRNGVDGAQLGFAPALGVGMSIPSAGDLHFVPEITYRSAFLDEQVNLIVGTINLVWDY